MIISENSEFVRKNVVENDLNPNQLEIPFHPPSLPPPPPIVEDPLQLEELVIVDYPPISWRSWTLGLVAGFGLGLLVGSGELQEALAQLLTSNTTSLWK